MFKRLILIMTIACWSPVSIKAQTGMDQTAAQIVAQMAPGWNLGNTLEAGNNADNYKNDGIGTETWWQSTRTTQAVIDYVKSQGFRSVRIPCAWVMGHITSATDYTIDPAWMARVKEVVDYCINDGLYVVLNDHWDGGWLENNIANTTAAVKTKNHDVLRAIWTQIATTFKDYDEHLLFAGLNEPNADNQAATNNLLAYEQTFIDAVRATGGNNAKRVLVVQGPNTDIDKTVSYYNAMPTDQVADRLIMEVHYYTPWQFCGMSKDESWGKYMLYWGADNSVSGSQRNYANGEAEMKRQLQKMKTKFVDQGIPVIIGEYGADWKTVTATTESQDKHTASIRLFYKLFNQYCMEMGMVPFAWDTNYIGRPSMTIINRKSLSIYASPMMEGIREAMEETGIQGVLGSLNQKDGFLFDLSGRKLPLPSDAQSHLSLGKGFYIMKGKKIIKY